LRRCFDCHFLWAIAVASAADLRLLPLFFGGQVVNVISDVVESKETKGEAERVAVALASSASSAPEEVTWVSTDASPALSPIPLQVATLLSGLWETTETAFTAGAKKAFRALRSELLSTGHRSCADRR
jgi:hypothetical protein